MASGCGDADDDGPKSMHSEPGAATSPCRETLRERLQEEFLCCKICLETFVRPKTLPCLHTFCFECLQVYVRRNPGNKQGFFPCPICRHEAAIPVAGVTSFPDNFMLLSLSQTLELEGDDCVVAPSSGLPSSHFDPLPPRPICPPSPQELRLRTHDWYFGKVSRDASEEWLLQPGYAKGTFLIRQGEATPNTYTLSVRDYYECKGYLVRHYKVFCKNDKEQNEHCYITQRRPFHSLHELVGHYSEVADGLCCKLTAVCPKPRSLKWSMERGTPDNWETSRVLIRFNVKLGTGQFAEVWHGKWGESREVAIKMQTKESVSSAAFIDEARILKTLQHDNIVQLLAVCSEQQPVFLIMEYMECGRLSQYLRDASGRALTDGQLMHIATQIACGMAYIEKERFVHRNLGARNILVAKNHLVKIAGFGMTKVSDDPDFNSRTGLKMAIKWMAPEVLLHNKYSHKSDTWSYAIVMVELYTQGREPYQGIPSKEAFAKIQEGYRMGRPERCPEQLYELMSQCWEYGPHSRPTFAVLHNKISEINAAVSDAGTVT